MEEAAALPRVLATHFFLPQLARLIGGASADVVAESLSRLARAAGWQSESTSLRLAERVEAWLSVSHRATIDVATGDAASKVGAIEQAVVDKASRAASLSSAAGGRSTGAAATDPGFAPGAGPVNSRLQQTDAPAVERLMLNGTFAHAVRKAEAVLGDPAQPDHLALQLALSGASRGHPEGRPFALLVQIAWNHAAASALSVTAKLHGLHGLHPRMLGAIAGQLVCPDHIHHVARQLAKEFSSNDWGSSAPKVADKSFVNFVAARNSGETAACLLLATAPDACALALPSRAVFSTLAGACPLSCGEHALTCLAACLRSHDGRSVVLFTAFKSWVREAGLYVDPPADEVYTKITHLTATEALASAAFAAYGMPAADPRSWRAMVTAVAADWELYAPSEDAAGDFAVRRRSAMGKRLRRLIFGLLSERAAAYNRFRRGTDIAADLDPSFFSDSSPAMAEWREYIERRSSQSKLMRAERIDDSGSDEELEPRPKRRSSGDASSAALQAAQRRIAELEQQQHEGGGRDRRPPGGGYVEQRRVQGWNRGHTVFTIGKSHYQRDALTAQIRRLGVDPSKVCLEVLLLKDQVGVPEAEVARWCGHKGAEGHQDYKSPAHSVTGVKIASCRCDEHGTLLPASGPASRGRGGADGGAKGGRGRGGRGGRGGGKGGGKGGEMTASTLAARE